MCGGGILGLACFIGVGERQARYHESVAGDVAEI